MSQSDRVLTIAELFTKHPRPWSIVDGYVVDVNKKDVGWNDSMDVVLTTLNRLHIEGVAVYDKTKASIAVLMTVEEFREDAANKTIMNDDGVGHPVKDGMEDKLYYIYPSRYFFGNHIPRDATHVNWYNK